MPDALYTPPVKVDIPDEVSLWLNFSVSNSQTWDLFLSPPFSPWHMHTQCRYQLSKFQFESQPVDLRKVDTFPWL